MQGKNVKGIQDHNMQCDKIKVQDKIMEVTKSLNITAEVDIILYDKMVSEVISGVEEKEGKQGEVSLKPEYDLNHSNLIHGSTESH